MTGKDAPLVMKKGGITGRGVFATADIPKGSWLCEYKVSRMFPPSQREEVVEEYNRKKEGCYIVESMYPVPSLGKMCWDATRCYHQLGRYLNHALHPNAEITKPYWARGKW